MNWKRLSLATVLWLTVMPAASLSAQNLRHAAQADAATLDPHALNEIFTLGFLGNFYEGLVRLGPGLSIEPALAERWEQVDPTRWRIHLRQGVTFHDGDPFDADDVIFSAGRARHEASNVKQRLTGVTDIVKVDTHTIDVVTEVPMPRLISEWHNWYIVSREWAEANSATAPADFRSGEENYAAAHVNGTGPFRLKKRTVDVETVAVPNAEWWGEPLHNLKEVTFTPVITDATRLAALASGEVDVIQPLPLQDVERVRNNPTLDALTFPELLTIFLGMDQASPDSPFADRRVRQALYRSIDIDVIRDVVMRGMSAPTAEMVAPEIEGAEPDVFRRLPADQEIARTLLSDAGFPSGIRLQMDCPNDRYVNDEEICEAIVQMAAKVGFQIDLFAQPRAKFFEKILGRDTTLYLLGWAPASLDSWNPIQNLHACDGDFNLGGYCNPMVDDLAGRIRAETDSERRRELTQEAWRIIYDDVAHIPLHQQVVAWGVRRGVEVQPRPDNILEWRNVRMTSE